MRQEGYLEEVATGHGEPTVGAGCTRPELPSGAQEIRFARAADGTHLAFALSGSGPPLVCLAGPFTHLELDEEHPLFAPALAVLRAVSTCLRLDERGSGLLDRAISDFSLATRVRDLAAVVDAAGLDRFALFATADAGPVAVSYAAQHPHRVTHLILAASFATAGTGYGTEVSRLVPTVTRLVRDGWGRSVAVRRMISVGLMPSLGEEMLDWFDEHQVALATATDAALRYASVHRCDASPSLSRVRTQTLVVHAVDDEVVRFEEARRVAATVPGARLQALDAGGHAFPVHADNMQWCRPALGEFLSTPTEPVHPASCPGPDRAPQIQQFSQRETEVLDLVAPG